MQYFGAFVFILCLAAVFGAAIDTTTTPHNFVPIVSEENVQGEDGSYHFSYESGDGSKVSQEGELKVIDAEHSGIVMRGTISYIGDDGVTYELKYIADENGFQPEANYLPVPPPIPDAIVKSLEVLATAVPPKDK